MKPDKQINRENLSTLINVMENLRPLHNIRKSAFKSVYSSDKKYGESRCSDQKNTDFKYLESKYADSKYTDSKHAFKKYTPSKLTDYNNNSNNNKDSYDKFYRERNINNINVINIKDENLLQTSDIKRVKKRKLSTLDQLLPQVEAKKRKQEAEFLLQQKQATEQQGGIKTRYITNHIVSHTKTINKDIEELEISKEPVKLRKQVKSVSTEKCFINKEDKRRLKSESSVIKERDSDGEKTSVIKHTAETGSSNTTKKRSKRTISTNQRYSTLSNAQLQRRLVANARERSRVHALSNAFDSLRATIPSFSTDQKLSKLTILKVAINYIKALDQILVMDSSGGSNQRFDTYVSECSRILQTEYGRSKTRLSID